MGEDENVWEDLGNVGSDPEINDKIKNYQPGDVSNKPELSDRAFVDIVDSEKLLKGSFADRLNRKKHLLGLMGIRYTTTYEGSQTVRVEVKSADAHDVHYQLMAIYYCAKRDLNEL